MRVPLSQLRAMLAAFNQLFPSRTPKIVLKVGYTSKVSVPKQLTIDRIMSNSERSPLISICDNDDFQGIGDQRNAVRLNITMSSDLPLTLKIAFKER